jgi:regulator of sigma E protease
MLAQPPALWLVLIAFVCMIGPLVFFHELGHYLVARWFKVRAETFSIGFGHEIFGWTDRLGTRWKVGWLPLGGYVKFVGDMNPASVPSPEEEIAPEVREGAFQLRPVWQRFLIVLAGPMANFLLAILIFAAFFTFVGTLRTNVVAEIQPNTAAQAAGIVPGDRILSVDGIDTPTFPDIASVVAVRPNQTVDIELERAGQVRELTVTLRSDVVEDGTGGKLRRGLLGIYPSTDIGAPVSIFRAVPMAAAHTWRLTRSIVDTIGQLFSGQVSSKQLGGPIKIAQFAGASAQQGLLPFVELLALFSINLGFINLLPVPMLDGGHLFFYGIEAVRRRPLSERAMEWSFRGGLAAILALLFFTTFNDLGSIGLWDRLQRLIG